MSQCRRTKLSSCNAKSQLTQRALDAGDSAAFSGIFLALSFFCSQAESTPAPAPVTPAVSLLLMARVFGTLRYLNNCAGYF